MSKDDTSTLSVLLPAARVDLFTRDESSRAAFQALKQDWRFARVVLDVHDGDARAAIDMYAGGAASPQLIIVQTDDIDESFSGKLEELSAYCSEGTRAIVIGPVNDVNLYRRLIGMGVSDYLVKPLQTETLGNDIAATLLEQLGATGSRLIAIMGVKGGVGATALSQTAAWALAEKHRQKTFLLDAAGGWSTLSVGMNFEPAATLAEAAKAAAERNEDSLTRMIFSAGPRLSVLSSGGDAMLENLVDATQYESLLDYVMAIYPVVLVDLSSAPHDLKRTVLTRAHKIILLTTPALPSVRAARTLMQEIKDLRGNSDEGIEVMLNMQGFAGKQEISKSQIEQGLDRKLGGAIPFEPALFASIENEGRKLHADKAGEVVTGQLMPSILKILNADQDEPEQADKKTGLNSLLTRLKTKS